MAFNDPFSFASDADLMPVYHHDTDFGPEYYDLFYNEDVLSDFQLSMDIRPVQQTPPIVESPSPAVLGPAVQPVTPSHNNAITPPSFMTEIDYAFPNPESNYEWQQPLTISKPESFFLKSESFFPKSDSIPVTSSNTNVVDESIELDTALSESNCNNEITHHFYYAPEPKTNAFSTFKQHDEVSHMKMKRPRIEDDSEGETDMALDTEVMDGTLNDEDDPTGGFKLPASKSPIMEAMVVCALNGWGIEIARNCRPTSTTPAEVVFRVTDFNRYYKISRAICSKQRPTDDLGSRIKSLRRWFINFPKKKDRCENSFSLSVKPTIAKKVNEIIERNTRSLGLTKRRRRQ